MLRPTEPRGYRLFELGRTDRRLTLGQPSYGTAKVSLYALAHQFLITEKLKPHIVQRPAVAVSPVASDREYLPIRFHGQQQLVLDVRSDDLSESRMQPFLAVGEEHDIIGILRAVKAQPLVYRVHKVTEHKVSKELRQVITDRQSVRAVYDFVKKPQQVAVLNLAAHNPFQHIVPYGWVELLDVYLQAIERSALV